MPLTLPWYPVALNMKSELLLGAYLDLPSFEQTLLFARLPPSSLCLGKYVTQEALNRYE